MSKCDALKKSGEPCANLGVYTYNDKAYCGVHVKGLKLDDPEKYRNAGTVKKEAPVNPSVLMQGIFDQVVGRIEAGMVPPEMEGEAVSTIMRLQGAPAHRIEAIMKDATYRCGSKDCIPTIMVHLVKSIVAHEAVALEKPVSPILEQHQFDYIQPVTIHMLARYERQGLSLCSSAVPKGAAATAAVPLKDAAAGKAIPIPSVVPLPDEQDACTEMNSFRGLRIEFPDVGVSIINCSETYLPLLGCGTLDEWKSRDCNIYMGPGSDWHIPMDSEFRFRMQQNVRDARRILDTLTTDREKVDRYTSLRGKTLGCVCVPSNCHCEVYVLVLRALMVRS